MKSGSLSVTGATGFVGWHITDTFLRHGWDVRAVVRPGNTKPVPVRARVVEADLEPGALTRACAGTEIIIHCAGTIRAPDEDAFNAVNVEGTRAAADAARRVGARFIHISSQAAGGPGTVAHPRSEFDQDAPVNAYGRSKLAAEATVRSTPRLQWTILRPCAAYGPRDTSFLTLFKMAKRRLLASPTRRDSSFTLIHVGDLVEAVRLTVLSPESIGETMYVGHPEPRTASEIMRIVASVCGRRSRAGRIPGAALSTAAALGNLLWKTGARPMIDGGRLAEFQAAGFVCSSGRIRDVVGFVADTVLEDGMARTARWYRDEGWL